MPVAGIRCFPDGFALIILDGSQREPTIVFHQRFLFPKNLSPGASLSWLRKQALTVLQEHRISAACIKAAEPFAKRKSPPRCEVEGVMKEAVFSALSIDCEPRIKSQLKRDLAFAGPARDLPKLLESKHLNTLNNDTFREAALAAVAELPSGT